MSAQLGINNSGFSVFHAAFVTERRFELLGPAFRAGSVGSHRRREDQECGGKSVVASNLLLTHLSKRWT